eukprot:3691937-Pyramimonas_sp.AAC.1
MSNVAGQRTTLQALDHLTRTFFLSGLAALGDPATEDLIQRILDQADSHQARFLALKEESWKAWIRSSFLGGSREAH